MAHTIRSSECINCTACREECPVDGIVESGRHHVITEEKCINCGSCSEICPVNCIVSE